MCLMFGRWSCAEDVLTGPLSAAKAGPLSTGLHSTLDNQAGEKMLNTSEDSNLLSCPLFLLILTKFQLISKSFSSWRLFSNNSLSLQVFGNSEVDIKEI